MHKGNKLSVHSTIINHRATRNGDISPTTKTLYLFFILLFSRQKSRSIQQPNSQSCTKQGSAAAADHEWRRRRTRSSLIEMGALLTWEGRYQKAAACSPVPKRGPGGGGEQRPALTWAIHSCALDNFVFPRVDPVNKIILLTACNSMSI